MSGARECNVAHRTIFTGDNLEVLRGLNSDCIDLVVLDPPFNSNRYYAAPVGSKAAGAAFKDTWSWDDVDEKAMDRIGKKAPHVKHVARLAGLVHSDSMASYILMIGERLLELRRVLTPTGSIWLHCDPTANSYLRALMDAVFGKANFRNEVVWCYTGPGFVKKHFQRKHDTLFYYAMGPETPFHLDAVRLPYKAKYTAARGVHGSHKGKGTLARHEKGKVPTDWWADGNISNVSGWRKERLGYPTQKPLKLYERVIKASSNPGDVVLDPFCGCATTCEAAERLGRRWIGIDLSEKAAELVRQRCRDIDGFLDESVHRRDIPLRTDRDPPIKSKNKRKNRLIVRDGSRCFYCRVEFLPRNLTEDHLVPRKKGGTDHLDNLVLACGHCNSRKGSKSLDAFRAELDEERDTFDREWT